MLLAGAFAAGFAGAAAGRDGLIGAFSVAFTGALLLVAGLAGGFAAGRDRVPDLATAFAIAAVLPAALAAPVVAFFFAGAAAWLGCGRVGAVLARDGGRDPGLAL